MTQDVVAFKLADDVGIGETFTIEYPDGRTRADYAPAAGHYVITNAYGTFGVRNGKASFNFGVADITITNLSPVDWALETDGYINLDIAAEGEGGSLLSFGIVYPQDFGAAADGVTDDTEAVTAAVAYAYANGLTVFWDGEYLTTASIPFLHDVRASGTGSIKRGADRWQISTFDNQANTLYVSTTGNDASDGLAAAQPMRTVQNAVDALARPDGVLTAPLTISCAAGTYNEVVTIPSGKFQSPSYLKVKGPSVATVQTAPTMILDGTSLTTDVALDCGQRNHVKLENIKFTDWSGADCTQIGTGGFLWAYNIQSTDGTARSLGVIDRSATAVVQGGRKTGGLIGFDCYSGSTLTLGYGATSTANGTIISDTTQAGVYCKSHVHVVSNYCQYNDNSLAVLGYHNSRFDTKGDNFKRNTRVFRMMGSYVSDNISPASVYNFGGADANSIVEELDQFSAFDVYHAGGRGGLDVAHQRSTTTLTGTIAATLARELTVVGGYRLTTSGRYIEVECIVAGAGAAGTKTVQLKLGTVVLGTYTIAAGTVIGKFRAVLWANNTTSAIVVNEATDLTLVTPMRATPVVDMTADQSLSVWLTVPGADDTASLHEARCVLWG